MSISQAELIETMANAYGEEASKAGMTRAYQALFDKIGNSMANGDDVSVRGFGTFSNVATKERQGRNPATQETITIPAGKKPKFKAAAALKERINK